MSETTAPPANVSDRAARFVEKWSRAELTSGPRATRIHRGEIVSILNSDQIRRAVEVLHGYVTAPINPDGQTPLARQAARDVERGQIIDKQMLPLVREFLAGNVPLTTFKTQMDGINKRHEYWGLRGSRGRCSSTWSSTSPTTSRNATRKLKLQ